MRVGYTYLELSKGIFIVHSTVDGIIFSLLLGLLLLEALLGVFFLRRGFVTRSKQRQQTV